VSLFSSPGPISSLQIYESRPAAPPRPAPWRPVHAHSRLGSTAQGSQRRRQVASRLTLGNGGSVGNIRTVKAHTWMAKGLAQCTHLTVSLVGPAPAAAGGTVKRQAPLQRGHDAWKSFGPAGGGDWAGGVIISGPGHDWAGSSAGGGGSCGEAPAAAARPETMKRAWHSKYDNSKASHSNCSHSE
jgi:hypothetical protein